MKQSNAATLCLKNYLKHDRFIMICWNLDHNRNESNFINFFFLQLVSHYRLLIRSFNNTLKDCNGVHDKKAIEYT